MTLNAPSKASPRLRRITAVWGNGWNRVGAQTQFYFTTIRLLGDAVVRYKTETLRLIAQMSLGTGALAVIGGTVAVVAFLTMSTGALIAFQGYDTFADIGVEALIGFASAYFNETSGDLLKADVDAIVNTVNCVGVMGKGIALQVKRRYPDVFAVYARECKAGNVRIGHMLTVPTNELHGPAWVINFPTKTHWKSPSKLSYIADGLPDLLRIVKELGIRSIAIPPLGAGNGGLDWSEVRPLIRDALDGLQDVRGELFTPTNAFQHIRQSARVKMTRARALVLALMNRYADAHAEVEPHSGKALSHLEIQKLLYFADVVDPSLNLSFSPGRYGPYSDKARHLLVGMEGAYISGFGDGNEKVLDFRPIQATERGDAELDHYLDSESESITPVVDHVMQLVKGYEEPYGLELLSSTHWVAINERAHATEIAAEAVRGWTQRKGRIFTDRHVGRAFGHLRAVGALKE